MCKGRRFLIGCYSTASIFFANVYTQEKEAGATFAWDVHDWLRGEKLLAVYLQIAISWNIISKSDHFPKFTPVMVVSLGEQALWGALSGRGQVCLCSSPPESTLKGQVMVASRLLKSVISHVIGYHPPLTHSEIKFIVASEIYRERNSRINMSLQTIGLSWKHALVSVLVDLGITFMLDRQSVPHK